MCCSIDYISIPPYVFISAESVLVKAGCWQQKLWAHNFVLLVRSSGAMEDAGTMGEVPEMSSCGKDSQESEAAPQFLEIGSPQAFAMHTQYVYERIEVGPETIYVCKRGSEYCLEGEVLVLRRSEIGWTAFDGRYIPQRRVLHLRQAVFRCLNADITKPGSYVWQANSEASRTALVARELWGEILKAETRLPPTQQVEA